MAYDPDVIRGYFDRYGEREWERFGRRADDALAELLRVSRPAAPLLLSVMSTYGSLRAYLRPILDTAAHTVAGVLDTGLLTQAFQSNDHVLKMYRWEELEALLSRHACTLELATACSFLTTGRPESVAELAPDDTTWRSILDWELRCCRERGALDAGTHTLVVVRKEP